MATENAEVKENENNPQNNHEIEASKTETDEQFDAVRGWLMKRTKISHKWKNTYFYLKDTDLLYGNSEQKTSKKISLQNSEISECTIDNKPHAFRVKPKDTKRIYYMCAPDEQTENMWMQAICFAKATGKSGGNSEACSIQ